MTPAGTSIDVQNGWEENTHTHTCSCYIFLLYVLAVYFCCMFLLYIFAVCSCYIFLLYFLAIYFCYIYFCYLSIFLLLVCSWYSMHFCYIYLLYIFAARVRIGRTGVAVGLLINGPEDSMCDFELENI